MVTFWTLIELVTSILLLYKFGECATELLDSFKPKKDVSSLFVLARVFYDNAVTLVERHLVLRTSLSSPDTLQSPSFWGLLATISLSKDGKKAIEGIGNME